MRSGAPKSIGAAVNAVIVMAGVATAEADTGR